MKGPKREKTFFYLNREKVLRRGVYEMHTIRHNHGRDYEENRNDNHSSIEKTVIQWKVSWSKNSEDWKKALTS